jgi:acetyl esterase/lipase
VDKKQFLMFPIIMLPEYYDKRAFKTLSMQLRFFRSFALTNFRGSGKNRYQGFFQIIVLVCLTLVSAHAAPVTTSHDEVPLWPGGAPGAHGNMPVDIPTLTLYLATPGKASGAAMIICPGGGYINLGSYEGADYALWLNEQGISAFVLKYRLGSDGYHHPIEMEDAQRAIRYVRASAIKWKLDPKKIGIIGSSAGGHLASTCLTHFDAGNPSAIDPIDRESCRPDLGVLCYAVITMGPNTHEGSRKSLLGEHPDPKLVEFLSNEKQVTKDTPPTFIFHCATDTTVKVENALDFAAALQRNHVSYALHIYAKGGHGIGLGTTQWDPEHRHPWTMECALWLKEMRFAR